MQACLASAALPGRLRVRPSQRRVKSRTTSMFRGEGSSNTREARTSESFNLHPPAMTETHFHHPLPIEQLAARSFTIATDAPEADGTLHWDATTIVIVSARAGDCQGIGYSYTHHCAAALINDKLRTLLEGSNALDIAAAWHRMAQQTRNLGRPGIVSAAIAAVDIALWDLKAKLLNLSLVRLLGAVRGGVAIYGSGGFTSYDDARLEKQLAGWADAGIPRMKMKVGEHAGDDARRIALAREAVGPAVELMVDANGAYSHKTALDLGNRFAELGVTWFEEPVSSDDLRGLRLVRMRVAPPIEVAAGEYGYHSDYFRRMLQAGAVDVLQLDASRCGGVTGFLAAAALGDAFQIPLSAHCMPAVHMHLGCAVQSLRHIEYFHDHVRIERLIFDGLPQPQQGCLHPDLSRPGLGLELRESVAAGYETT